MQSRKHLFPCISLNVLLLSTLKQNKLANFFLLYLNYHHAHGYLLVQVDRKLYPPAVKIMDFHKEMYKKETKVKERLKAKVFFKLCIV